MDQEQQYKQLFVGGDLSGIQKFLYNISSKKAAVSLKGRSYFLQQYMENVCTGLMDVTKKAGAQHSTDIYCSGGKFYVVTDYSLEITTAIDQYTSKVTFDLWHEHRGQLGINISYVPFTENSDGTVDCDGKTHLKPGYLWKVVNADFFRQKNQKFKEQLTSSFSSFFTPISVGSKTRVCAITGIESDDCVPYKLNDEGETYVLPSVLKQIQLGESLRNTEHFKTFEDYAGNTNLGILRMDVDGLGKRFIDGFDSIDAYTNFSNRLVDFFDKGLKHFLSGYREHLNIIYSGGDDLFIVGRWDKVIEFAEIIQTKIATYFQNEGISISGGVAIVQPAFPISKAAQLAGEAEDAAKQFRNGEKNAFHFLGRTVSWNEEFNYVRSFKDQFVFLINDYGLSKSILHKLMLYASIAEQNEVRRREGKAEDFSYVWHISYYLTRYIERYKSNETISIFCRSLRDKELTFNNGRKLQLIALAARWAELLLKDKIY